MQKVDILFIGYSLKLGGAERKLLETADFFSKQNKNIKILLLKNEVELLIPSTVEEDIIFLDSGFTFKSLINIYIKIREIKPYYVFGFLGHINVMLGILKLFFSDVIFVGRENATYEPYFNEKGKIKGCILKKLYSLYLKNLDKIIFQSEYAKKEAVTMFGLPNNKVYVLENPIVVSKGDIKLAKDITRDPFLLLSVGRLADVKNQKEMLDVLLLLPKDYKLCFIGVGDKEKELKDYTLKKGLTSRVEFLGYVNNVQDYYKKAGLLLLTSYRETFPNVVLEATANQLYTVSYVMPGAIEEVIEEGVNGSLVFSNNIFDLKDYILKNSGRLAKIPSHLSDQKDYFYRLELILEN